MNFQIFCLDVLLTQSVYPNVQRKSMYRHSCLSVIRLSAYQYNFRNENSICWFSQPMREKSVIHTFISCCIDMPRRKVLEVPSRVTSTDFISLLTSVIKMRSHLSDKRIISFKNSVATAAAPHLVYSSNPLSFQ